MSVVIMCDFCLTFANRFGLFFKKIRNQNISLFYLWPWAENTEAPAHPGLHTVARA
jgi:hypothetical protein